MYLWILLFTSINYDWMDQCVYWVNLSVVIFFFHKLYFLWAAQFKVSPLAMPSGCVVYVTLWTHTHILTHTFSLNVGQLSMSAAEGLALKLDFHISPHLTQYPLSCQVKVSTNVLTHRRIGYRFIPPHSDEMRMWDEICVLLDWWFT